MYCYDVISTNPQKGQQKHLHRIFPSYTSPCVRVLPVPATDSRARHTARRYRPRFVHGPLHAQPTMDKIEYKRLEYKHEGRTIYEWHQSLEEVHVYIAPPPGVTAKMIDCKILPTQLTLGIKGNPPFMDEPFAEYVNAGESYWTWEDAEAPREGKELHLCITKGSKGVTWNSLLRGHTEVDPLTQQELQKSLMLERFQAENPGFDFSGASFNGQVPDAKTFMGGVGYQ